MGAREVRDVGEEKKDVVRYHGRKKGHVTVLVYSLQYSFMRGGCLPYLSLYGAMSHFLLLCNA